MRAFAPGKLVLTGAYAVLEGAPSISVAVSRGAYADGADVAASPTPEVKAALGDAPAPRVDASSMFAGSRKLGLGASAAILVASLAVREAEAKEDLSSDSVRRRIFTRAREAHAAAQRGGSGVDVAVSVYGGVVRYVMGELPRRVALPRGLGVSVFAHEVSARTSEMRASVDRLAETSPGERRACMEDLAASARDAATAVGDDDAAAFVECLRRTARALSRLGEAARVAIVPSGFEKLEAIAASEGASFSVSGAGGGDVAVYVGGSTPSSAFIDQARALGLSLLDVSLDDGGVRTAPPIRATAVSDFDAAASAALSHPSSSTRSTFG